MSRQCVALLSRPADSPGKPLAVTCPKPSPVSVSWICCGSRLKATLAMPTLLDLARIILRSTAPRLCLSVMFLMPTRKVPGAVSTTVSGR